MPQHLTNVTVDRVDLVDNGANPGAKIAMFKRDTLAKHIKEEDGKFTVTSQDGSKKLGTYKTRAEAEARLKQVEAFKRGTSMVDGLFKSLLDQYPDLTSQPINLDGAGHVHAIYDALPAEAKTFDDVVAEDTAEDVSQKLLCDIDEATCTLRESVCSIIEDDDVTDKTKMLEETFTQYHDHLQTLAGANLAKAIGHAVAVNKGVGPMTEDEIKKAIVTEVAKTQVAKDAEIKKLQDEIAALKKDGGEMTAEEKAAAKAKADKEAKDKADGVEKKLTTEDLPEAVRKQLGELDEIKKQNAVFAEEREVVAFGKRAVAAGLAEAEGEILRKAYKGDPEAIKKLEEKITGLNAQVKKGDLYKEFGNNRGGSAGGNAMAQLIAKRDELMKTDPKLTTEQAFAKIYADPANRELTTLEKRERLAGGAAAAA